MNIRKIKEISYINTKLDDNNKQHKNNNNNNSNNFSNDLDKETKKINEEKDNNINEELVISLLKRGFTTEDIVLLTFFSTSEVNEFIYKKLASKDKELYTSVTSKMKIKEYERNKRQW